MIVSGELLSEFVLDIPSDGVHFDEFQTVVFESADGAVVHCMITVFEYLKKAGQVVSLIILFC